MSAVVVPAFLIACLHNGHFTFFSSLAVAASNPPGQLSTAWLAVGTLTLVTFFSRLTLFMGVKHLGGLQTAMLGLSELLVTIVVAYLWLGERLSPQQWLGALLLVIGLGLIGLEKPQPRNANYTGWLSWLRPPGLPADFP
jgi:drug/metabolite transporter (DMT)-like permease